MADVVVAEFPLDVPSSSLVKVPLPVEVKVVTGLLLVFVLVLVLVLLRVGKEVINV